MGMQIAWTEISNKDVRAAAQSLRSPSEGVVDEVGVRVLHSLYADRFFPGVSVQQKRLRYIFLVPWILETIASRPLKSRDPRRDLRDAEVKLAQLLVKGGETRGVVGSTQLGQPVKLAPSAMYLSLLVQLGMVPENRLAGRAFTLEEMLTSLRDRGPKPVLDDEGRRLDAELRLPETGLPVPAQFLDVATTHQLTTAERSVAVRRLQEICRFGELRQPISLLGRLAAMHSAPDPMKLFSIDGAEARAQAVAAGAEAADVLERAAKAASLAAVARGVYAALLETECEEADKRDIGRLHRDALGKIIGTHGAFARDLDLVAVRNDGDPRSGSWRALRPSHHIHDLFSITLLALRADRVDTADGLAGLRPTYQKAEWIRKGAQARLVPTATMRRASWNAVEHGTAEPLHYRAFVVASFLADLRGEQP